MAYSRARRLSQLLNSDGTMRSEKISSGAIDTTKIAAGALQISSESFADNDTTLMTSASVQDKILSYGYTTEVGDITGITAGTGVTGGGTTGNVTINIGQAVATSDSPTFTNLTLSGNLTVNGTTTTLNSTTLTIDDKNIELGSVATPSDTTADGGGITLKGASDKTILWTNSTDTWDFNQGINVTGTLGVTGVISPTTHIDMPDDAIIKLGTGDDLQIYHSGTYNRNYIQATGSNHDLTIAGDEIALTNSAISETFATFVADGAVTLKYDNSDKLATVTGGINITGDTDTDTLTVSGAATVGGTLGVTGAITGTLATVAQPNITSLGTLTSLTVDTITLNAGTMSSTASNFILDAAGEIHLDADDGIIRIRDDGGDFGMLQISNSDFIVRSMVADKDLIFKGYDASSLITALTLDMSDAGTALFNSSAHIKNGGEVRAYRSGNSAYGSMFMDTGEKIFIRNSYANKDLNFTREGNFGILVANPKATLHLKPVGNNWEDGILLEHDDATTGWNIHPEQTGNGLWFGYNSDTSVALTSQNASPILKLVAAGEVNVTGNVVVSGTISTSTTLSSFTDRIKIFNGSAQLNIGQWDGSNHRIEADSNRKFVITSYSSDGIHMGGSGASDLVIKGNKVGIGDTDPFSKLHVEDTGWSSGAPYGTVLSVTGNNVNDNNWGHLIVTDSTTSTGHGGSIRFGTGTADSSNLNPFSGIQGKSEGTSWGGLAFYTRPQSGTATERMVIDSTGQVGIGVAGPTALLDVRGSGTSDKRMHLISTSLANGGDVDLVFGRDNGNNLSGRLRYYYNTTQSARYIMLHHFGDSTGLTIKDGGTTSIGTNMTQTYNSAAGYPLHIQASTGQQTYLAISVPGANSGDTGLVIGHDQTGTRITNREDDPIIFARASGETMRIHGDGNVGINRTAPSAALDVKDQINVTNAQNVSLLGLKATVFGYNTGYKVLQIGSGGTTTSDNIAIGVDLSGNASGSFTGYGESVYFRNAVRIRTPNSANNGFHDYLHLNNGNVGIGPHANAGVPIRLLTVAGGNGVATLIQCDEDTAGGTSGLYFKNDSTNNDRRIKAGIIFQRDDPGTRGTGSLHLCVEGVNSDTNVATNHSKLEIDYRGITRIPGPFVARGNGPQAGNDHSGGYEGSDGIGFGHSAIFTTDSIQSPNSGAGSSQFLSVYSSGHWGEYPMMRLTYYNLYYKAGYRQYLYQLTATTSTLTEIRSFGDAGTISVGSQVTVGSGTHSGQSVYRRDLTFTTAGSYRRGYVVIEMAFGDGHASKWFSSDATQSEVDSYLSTRGGGYHFKTLSAGAMNYQYTDI